MPGNDGIEVGYVAKAHGVTGELKVVLHNAESAILGETDTISIGSVCYRLTAVRRASDAFLIRVDGIGDRDAAAALKGSPVLVDRSAYDLADGETFLSDLVGFQAVTVDGSIWGEVVDVQAGAQIRLVVHHHGTERLLPYVPAFIVSVDAGARQVVVDPPEGLPEAPIGS